MITDRAIEILREIRDGIGALREDFDERLDQTNQRLYQTIQRLDQSNERLGRLEDDVANLKDRVLRLEEQAGAGPKGGHVVGAHAPPNTLFARPSLSSVHTPLAASTNSSGFESRGHRNRA